MFNYKYIHALIIANLLLSLVPQHAFADNDEVADLVTNLNCVVTAYYQPIAEQKNFERGSLAADIAMNGDDTAADGTKVKLGLVAAPPDYPFGTIVDIHGFGVGEVHDRGGAIKGNRFDIWVGKGDEGLARALNWGKRTTNCTVYLPGSSVPAEVKERIGKYNLPPASLPSSYWEKKLSGGRKNLSLGESGENVLFLRKSLNNIGLKVALTGEFDKALENQVIAFQIQQKIIVNAESYGAGIVGPRTWQALLSQKPETKELIEEAPEGKSDASGSGQVITVALEYGAQGLEVSKLQENLRLLGYFDGPTITGYFGPSTKAAIVRFQLAEKLIAKADDTRAGNFDEKTREQMLAVLLGKKTTVPDPVLVLKRGSKGTEVKILQEKLQKIGVYTGPITDFYGEQTEKAVKDFQSQYHVQLASAASEGSFELKTATRLDQSLGMDISLSPTFIRYIEQFTLVQGTLTKGN
ncbi:MAG: peptidoglycan-binding protein [Candidatus Abawacabacteria bacterium]|nr:peptidoglycan-binding protein [Candidatus Abawacabacteria bacterium]